MDVSKIIFYNFHIVCFTQQEALLEQATKAVARKQVDADYLEKRICFLEEEEKRRKRIIPLPPSSYSYVENRKNLAMNPYHSDSTPTPSSLPYWPSEKGDPWSEYRKEFKRKGGNARDV
jgi:hypothetical protein